MSSKNFWMTSGTSLADDEADADALAGCSAAGPRIVLWKAMEIMFPCLLLRKPPLLLLWLLLLLAAGCCCCCCHVFRQGCHRQASGTTHKTTRVISGAPG